MLGIYVCMYRYVCAHVYIVIYEYIYIHECIHIGTHIYVSIKPLGNFSERFVINKAFSEISIMGSVPLIKSVLGKNALYQMFLQRYICRN